MLEAVSDVCTPDLCTEVSAFLKTNSRPTVNAPPPPLLTALSTEQALALLTKGQIDPARLSDSDVLTLGRLQFKSPVPRTASNAELLDYLDDQLFRLPALA